MVQFLRTSQCLGENSLHVCAVMAVHGRTTRGGGTRRDPQLMSLGVCHAAPLPQLHLSHLRSSEAYLSFPPWVRCRLFHQVWRISGWNSWCFYLPRSSPEFCERRSLRTCFFKNMLTWRTSLVVQWLRPLAPKARGTVWIPAWGTNPMCYAAWPKINIYFLMLT